MLSLMAESESVRLAPMAYGAEAWAPFGSHNKESAQEIDQSHAVCKMHHAKFKYTRNTMNLTAQSAKQFFLKTDFMYLVVCSLYDDSFPKIRF